MQGKFEVSSSPTNCFIIGYYGYDNAGDERLLTKTVSVLRQINPSVNVCALYPKKAIQSKTKPFSGSSILGETTYCPRYSMLGLISTFLKADIVIFGGGGLLQNKTSQRSLLYYLFLLWLALLFKRPVVFIGQGVGPVTGKFSKALLGRLVNQTQAIAVRDQASKNQLLDCKVLENKITVAADLFYIGAKFQHQPIDGLPVIGVSLRPSAVSIEAFDVIIKGLAECEHDFVFLDFHHHQDSALLGRYPDIEDKWLDIVNMNHVLSTKKMKTALENYSIKSIVGMRYHACVWASIMNIPFVALAYDEKVLALATELGQPVFDLTQSKNLDPEDLRNSLIELNANHERYQKTLIEGVKKLQERSYKNKELLELWLPHS